MRTTDETVDFLLERAFQYKTMNGKCILLDEKDNVATATDELKEGEKIKVEKNEGIREVLVNQDIPFGHKFALSEIKEKENVIKYGYSIGEASENIKAGEHVHTHNLVSKRGTADVD